ncbi:MAG: hypothetical protein ACRCX2_31710 [Paraclostridium sp.]
MDMELIRYMYDKTGKHSLSMDLVMGISVIDHYKTAGGFMVEEFNKIVGKNSGKILEALMKQRLITINEGVIFVTREIYSLRARAEDHFESRYSGVVTMF